MPSELKTPYDSQGFVIVPDLIDLDSLTRYEDAAERTISKTRTGEWPHRRTVGRQFPPYGEDNPDSWGVQHLMHLDLGEPAWIELYTSAYVNVAKELLECEEDDLQMGECWMIMMY
ncbi:hypothetical protein QCA50_015067 [Cerrena zonata]|uniref:Uncharacterized protein n=1 Tax=Cerrena zonata TaxID=2478898 RepID=A0AAW0FJX3_9APHY